MDQVFEIKQNMEDAVEQIETRRCTRCGSEIVPIDHPKRFRGVNIKITEITISQIEDEKPYAFASMETLCSRCKDEFLLRFNAFMKNGNAGYGQKESA
ncbi:MAG: hypothetical protein JW908_00635 [Anaerolineales bacterium]|nr:hypothetical protein [Anaerolineales bacterium]